MIRYSPPDLPAYVAVPVVGVGFDEAGEQALGFVEVEVGDLDAVARH